MTTRIMLLAAASLGTVTIASPAFAAQTITLTNACNAAPADITNVSAANQTCSGYYAGQLLSNGGNDPDNQKAALASLGFNTTGFNFTSYTKVAGLGGLQTITGLGPLTGTTYLAVHYGGGVNSPTPGAGSTAFYRLDLGSTVINSINLNFGSASDIVLYATGGAVPEPAAWAMMIVGFGAVGGAMRRRRTSVAFA